MFKVVWKSFKYNRKNFLSFFMSEILSVAVIFMLIYIQEALSQVPGIKTEALQFAYQSELRKQLRIIIPCIILIMILVTGYSVKAYINTRIRDYKLFQLLGIRKKNLKVMIGLEYVISGMLACGFGILFGQIGTKIIKEILHTRINARFVKGISMSRVYLVLILSCLIMTIGVYITLQILLDTRTDLGDKIFKIKESRINSIISVIYFIVSILVISSGYLLVNNDPMMAYMALICILTGLIILMIFGTGFFMEKYSESKYYKKHILAWNDCYCYIKKHGFRMLMQILLGIILIFNTFLMLRGTIHDRYMPNDFVCIGNSKETTAVNTVVTARFNGLTKQFPFLWFNEMGGDSWVAISLSDYNKIYNKNESLNKNEIIRIWRKEGSRKSDLSDKQHRKIKSIALGKCGNTDEEGLEYKYNFQIKKEQIKEMIGFSMTGLVIIPDNIFTQAEKESDYKKMFMIINVPKKNLTVSTRYIEEKLQQGKLDEAFCKLTIQGIDKKENVLNQMVAILVAIIILIFTMFITWLMLQNDSEHFKEMIGFSMTGLVIIPDNIFTQAEKESDYKKMFMIINVPKKNLTVSTRYIEEKLQQGKLDEAFCKLTIQGIDKKENVLNQMVAILVAIIILIFTMFITWLMLQNDQEHLKRKYQIGAILGVKRKEGYLSVVKEISRDMWWSLLLAIGISGMFCGVFIKSYYYGTMEIVLIQKEVAMLGWILCIYGIIFMIFIIFSTRRLWKEISKIWGDKN